MSTDDPVREWGWAVAFVLALLLLVYLRFGRRRHNAPERRARSAAKREAAPETTPAQLLRARVQFLIALALLAAILFVYLVSRLDSGG